MIGVYLSGTGNTKYCVQQYLLAYEGKAEMYAIEDPQVVGKISENEEILLAHGVQYSNTPKMVRDFICKHEKLWQGKKIYVMTTMGLFSGDGSGVTARLLKKYGAKIIGGLHINMPDSVADVAALKRNTEKNKEIVKRAVIKIKEAAEKMKKGRPTQQGLSIGSHLMGLFCQRLYFYGKTKDYAHGLVINKEQCMGCGKCSQNCPMHNISMKDGKAVAGNQCTMCYRCISQCPQQAITLIGKQVVYQSKIENYL